MMIRQPYKKPVIPSQKTLFDNNKHATKKEINCVKIGIIQEFDASNQTAVVEIAFTQVVTIDAAGVKTIQEYPLLLQVPVFVLFGGVDFMSMPIKAGDNCILLFNDRDIDSWFIGSDKAYPNTSRLHDLSDAIALVGINPITKSIGDYITNGIRLSHSEGATRTRIDLLDAIINIYANNVVIHGNLEVTGGLQIDGGEGSSNVEIRCDIHQDTGFTLKAGNGASGTFETVIVENGIVIGGT
jgi:Phage protein Gp138 N-terminal domain